jgi:hypothetical protein
MLPVLPVAVVVPDVDASRSNAATSVSCVRDELLLGLADAHVTEQLSGLFD